MAAEQCSECGARPGTEGTPACECQGGTTASSDSFAPQRVRPYFAPGGEEVPEPGTALERTPAIRTVTVHPVREAGRRARTAVRRGWLGDPVSAAAADADARRAQSSR